MKERPIIFSTPMVQAILEGRKTMTRRIIKPQIAINEHSGVSWKGGAFGCSSDRSERGAIRNFISCLESNIMTNGKKNWYFCPYGTKGDRLWVRESWSRPCVGCSSEFQPQTVGETYVTTCEECNQNDEYFYKSGWKDEEHPLWKSPIYMPYEASRIILQIEEVRVERLQDISEDDAMFEGAHPEFEVDIATFVKDKKWNPESTYRLGFKHRWNGINGKRAPWESNPWVWVISFKVVEPSSDTPRT